MTVCHSLLTKRLHRVGEEAKSNIQLLQLLALVEQLYLSPHSLFSYNMSFRNKKPVKTVTSASQGASKLPVDKFQHGSSSMNMKKQLLHPPGLGPSE